MDSQEPVVVYTTDNPTQAEIIKNFLVDEGIQCQIAGERQMELTGIGIIEIQLLVHASDVDRARELIEEHEATEPDWDEALEGLDEEGEDE
jgi:hypothetical protein